ncbi:acyl-CoA dehydrogenase family protein [Streptomyces sp. LP11]|uniref:Acyl-CoA dehydrogenase family protein n=1 Tax=Streptomyces pyxinicus TaxID=2970331 RepID=A0ABT2BDF1_9ACTN|nr:acyl-CoA dehydrogenase family protein [Streptomyces sp. LP11]MCS0606470.1 acyl-CoA dehydrogenase family protein [Streptomyces sp. LP11]
MTPHSAPLPGDPQPAAPAVLQARRTARVAAWHADEADARRRLDPDVIAEITRAGFGRHFVPAEHGGAEGSFGELVRATAEVAEGCTSAAWVAALFAAHSRLAAYLPARARRELWDASPDVRIAAGVAQPRLRAVAEPGGWLLSGEWPNVSGIAFADWVLLAALAEGPDGDVSTLFLVPAADCEVLDTWNTLGMRGTGSNTVRLDGARVPAHRTVPRERLLAPREPGAARCHIVPYPFVAALMFAAPVLGAARGALADWTRTARERTGPADPDSGPRTVLTRSAAELRAAKLLMDSAAARADEARIEPLTVAETVRDVVAAVEMCATAVDRLLGTAGSREQSHDDPVQRRRRDIRTASTHAMLRFDSSAQAYARAVLGA